MLLIGKLVKSNFDKTYNNIFPMQELKQKFPAELHVTKVSLMEFYKHSSIDKKYANIG